MQRWLLLAKDDNGQTAWHLAAQHGYEEILEKIWVWDRKVQLTREDDLLLVKDDNGQTAWHLAAQHVYEEILEKIWVWDRKV